MQLEHGDFNIEYNEFNIESGGLHIEPGGFNIEYDEFSIESRGLHIEPGCFNIEYDEFNIESGSFNFESGSFNFESGSFKFESGSIMPLFGEMRQKFQVLMRTSIHFTPDGLSKPPISLSLNDEALSTPSVNGSPFTLAEVMTRIAYQLTCKSHSCHCLQLIDKWRFSLVAVIGTSFDCTY